MQVYRGLRVLCLLIGGGALAACGGEREAAAAPGAEHGQVAQHEHSEHGGHEGMPDMPGMAEEGARAPAGTAWAELNAARDAIAQVVASGKLSEVHEKSKRLEPLGEALVAGAKSLPEDKRTRLEATLRQLPQVADALHDAADAGNADATRRELERLDGLIALIRAQYPADALEKVPAPGGPQGEHSHSEAEPPAHEHGAHMHATRPLAAVDDAPKATLHVKSSEFKFEPRALAMKAGVPTRIELENSGKIEHALIVAAPDGKGDWIHLHAQADATDAGTFRIDQAGKYRVLCTVPGHTEAGMVGELIVQ